MNLERLRHAWKKRVWISVLANLHSEVEVQVGGRRMLVDLRDHIIGRLLYLYGEYEPDFHTLMQYMDLEGSVCLDIGANIGVHTIVMSALVGNSGQVFAYEPESHNFRLLKHNLRINQATNTIARKQAIGKTEGICSLALNPTNYGDHRISTAKNETGTVQDVPITTIDSALGALPSGVIKLIKIDVQGYEYQVIQGMTDILERNPSSILMIEVFPEALRSAGSSATELMQYLVALGFAGRELHPSRIMPISEPWVYELIRHGKDVNLVLSREPALLKSVLLNWHENAISAPTSSKCSAYLS